MKELEYKAFVELVESFSQGIKQFVDEINKLQNNLQDAINLAKRKHGKYDDLDKILSMGIVELKEKLKKDEIKKMLDDLMNKITEDDGNEKKN